MTINLLQKLVKLLTVIAVLLLIDGIALATFPQKKINFWSTQQKGANIFNHTIAVADIKAAKKYGIKFIRLAPDRFPSSHRDFLIGNADNYQGLIKEDLEKLKSILDMCHQEGIFVIITMLSLPGCRWKQNNQDKDDLRIWKEEKYQIQAAQFWQDLAAALKDHPAVVGYNLLNEPKLERIFKSTGEMIDAAPQEKVQKILYTFYKRMIKSIRTVDKHTPLILDSSTNADPRTFALLIPHKDENVLYSLHVYEPFKYTNHKTNKGRFSYPGEIDGKLWNQAALESYMSAVTHFQKVHNIPSNRILVGEFGGHRKSPGLERYFEDLISIFNKKGWSFAFYAFREDVWEGMDYEVGSGRLPWRYWQAVERGEKPPLERKDTHPAFSILKKALAENHSSL